MANLVVVPRSILHHYKHCTRVYQGVLPSSPLKDFNKAVSQQICKKYNWQHVNTKLAICTAHIEGRQTGPRALLHALRHYALWAKITLADFICQFQPRLLNLIPFPAVQYVFYICFSFQLWFSYRME